MLSSLTIENIAVIQQASIRFEGGLNVFTGETGAGKTILISAIDAVLGERVSRDIIRTGESKASVRALFEDISDSAREALRELGYADDDGSVLIHREILASGKSTSKINGLPATASILKGISSLLIHIHGQRDTGQLLSDERHIELIDTFGGHQDAIAHYAEAYDRLCAIRDELAALDMDEREKAQRIDLLSYQVNEIEAANLDDPDEEDILTARKKRIGASEKILASLSAAYAALTGDEEVGGIDTLFPELERGVAEAAQYIDSLQPLADRLADITEELNEAAHELRRELDGFEFDPRELDEIEYRLDTLYKLGRKYGGSVAEIIEYGEQAARELAAITSGEQRTAELREQLDTAREETRTRADKLSALRAKAAKQFMKQVQEELAFLDMPAVQLSVEHERTEPGANGADDMRFFVTTNVGETPKPLSKIASGGEVSRMMLAMKSVLADRDHIDTLIFDEVDIGVSGRAAQKIGRKLLDVSHKRQVICVTHLAQVAAFADYHLLIRKEVERGRTFTRVVELSPDDRAQELARITSGDVITETALQNARELIAHARANN